MGQPGPWPGAGPRAASGFSSWSRQMSTGVKDKPKPNLCRKEIHYVLLPVLKPALLPFCSSHLSSALLLPHSPPLGPGTIASSPLGFATTPTSLMLHSLLCPLLPAPAQLHPSQCLRVLPVQVPERESDWLSSPHPSSAS